MSKTESKRTIPSTSIESQEVERLLLAAMETEEIVTYEAMSIAAMGDIRKEKRWALDTARKVVLRDHSVWFQTVRGRGVRRATSQEIIDEASQGIKIVHRRMQRDLSKMKAITDYEELPNEDKIKYNARTSQLGMLFHVSKSSKVKLIEGKVKTNNQRLSLPETFELFSGKKKETGND